MIPTTLLCEIIAIGGKVGAASYLGDPVFATLVRLGFLRDAGVLTSIICDDCEMPHAAAVAFEDGCYGYYCPELGFVVLERSAVEAVRPDVGRLVEHLVATLGCKRRKQTPVLGQTWRIGALDPVAGEILVYFHPTLRCEEDVRQLTDALSREVRARWRLIVTAAGTMPLADARVVQLDDLVEMDAETGILHVLTLPADLLGIPRKHSGGRPSEHGNLLKPLIERRIRTGEAAEGVNAEARAVLSAFQTDNPEKPAPSASSIKRHIRKARGGS